MHISFSNAAQQSSLPVPVHLIRPVVLQAELQAEMKRKKYILPVPVHLIRLVLQVELQAEMSEHLVRDNPCNVLNMLKLTLTMVFIRRTVSNTITTVCPWTNSGVVYSWSTETIRDSVPLSITTT